MHKHKTANWLINTLIVLGALVMMFPLVWTVSTSLSSGVGLSSTPSLIPEDPSVSAYKELFERTNFGRVIVNSFVIAAIVTVAQLFTSSTAGYVFSRIQFSGREILFGIYLVTMMIPLQVLLVPLFSMMRTFGLVDTYAGALLPSLAAPFGIFLFRQAMGSVPKELDEAATLDGAGHFRIFTQVIMPQMGPTVATLTVFVFMGSWNSFLWPLVILRSEHLQTLPLALARLQGQYTTQWDIVMAGSVISILPMLAVYLFAQKYVIQGVASSGLK